MDSEIITSGGAETAVIADLVERLHAPHKLIAEDPRATVPAVPFVVLPSGLKVHDLKPLLDAYRDNPERRSGTATLFTIDSFIDHVNRFKDEDSVVFADNTWKAPEPAETEQEKRSRKRQPNQGWKTPSFTAVLDYHEAVNMAPDEHGAVERLPSEALPRFGKHRASYAFPLSDEFMAWMEANGQPMGQGDFAAFLEERALDIEPPPVTDGFFTGQAPAPAYDAPEADRRRYEFMELLRTMTARLGGKWAGPERMMELSRGLKVNESNRVEAKANVSSGAGGIVFMSEHTDEKGELLEVPNLFLISIPIFKNGPRYLMPVRLRYRVAGGRVLWFYDTYRHDKTFDAAFDEACTRVRGETGLPLLVGTPEA